MREYSREDNCIGCAHKIVQFRSFHRDFRLVSRTVGLLFLEIFGVLEGNFSYFIEFIYHRTYKIIFTSYGTSGTVNFWNLVPSKKNYLSSRDFPHFISQFRNVIIFLRNFCFIFFVSNFSFLANSIYITTKHLYLQTLSIFYHTTMRHVPARI